MKKLLLLLAAGPLAAACGDHSEALGIWGAPPNGAPPPTPNTNVSFGGAQDFGYFRRLIAEGQVPRSDDLDDGGFFAEHHTPLPDPVCGANLCLQAMFGVMTNPSDGRTTTLLQLGLNSPIVADPKAQPPLTLAVVIDVSGSMNEQGKIDYVRQGLLGLIDALDPEDRIALVTYDSVARVVRPMGELGDTHDLLRSQVQALRADGSTNIWAGLELGYREVQANFDGSRENRVILLSDGNPTVGVTNVEQMLELSRPFNSDGLGLTTIGLGTDFNLALMQGLAEQGDGNFYFVENGAAVSEVFTEEVSYFTVPIARDVELVMDSGADFDLAAVYGSSKFERTRAGGKVELPTVFLAGRSSDDDVTPQGGRRGGGSALLLELGAMPDLESTPGYAEIANVQLSFVDPERGVGVAESLRLVLPYEIEQVPKSGYFQGPIVTKSFLMLSLLLGLRQACDEFHAGKGEQAIVGLRRLAAMVEDYNLEVGDLDLVYDLEIVQGLEDAILAHGVTAPIDSGIPADPWPGD